MTKGMILAAGQGTRVRPLTKDLPKPMVPLLGKPLLEYLIEHLARHGIRQIMINVAWHHHHIERYFGDGRRWGVEIGYSYEGVLEHGDVVPRPMGSAGGLKRIQGFSGFFDETTLVLCGDALIDLDIGAALEEHHRKRALASIVTLDVPREEVSNYGIVVADAEGRIQSFQEKPSPDSARSTLASTGIYLIEPAVLDRIPAGRVYDFGSQLFPDLVQAQVPFYAQQHQFNWIDIGRVTDYWSVLQRVLLGEVAAMHMPGTQVRPGVWVGLNTQVPFDEIEVRGPVYIGSSTRIEPGAVIEGPGWIGHGCHIMAGSRLSRSVLFEYTRIPPRQRVTDMIVSRDYAVDRHGRTWYRGDDTSELRWGDARAESARGGTG